MGAEIAVVISFFVILAFVVLVRVKSEGKAEIRPTDAIVALVPLLLILLVSGYFKKLVIGLEGVEIETAAAAIVSASNTVIEASVSPLPITDYAYVEKGSVDLIPAMIAERTPMLLFNVGSGAYVTDVVEQYFRALSTQNFFRFVLFNSLDGSFFALCTAPLLGAYLSEDNARYRQFVDEVNDGGIVSAIAGSHGCLTSEAAVTKTADKGDVLKRFDALKVDWLPVIEGGGFAGVVEKSQLTVSLLVDVVNTLRQREAAEGDKPEP